MKTLTCSQNSNSNKRFTHKKLTQWLFKDWRKKEKKTVQQQWENVILCNRHKEHIRWSVNLLNALKQCWNIRKIKWNTINLKEEIRHWKIHANKKSEKNNEWSHKIRKLNLKQSLRTYSQNADSVK